MQKGDWLKVTGRNKSLQRLLQLGLFFWIAQIGVIFSFWRSLPPQLPLFYSRPWGEEQLTSLLGFWLLPLLGLAIMVINLIFAAFVPKEEKLIRQMLVSTGVFFNLLCLITLVQIIRLVA